MGSKYLGSGGGGDSSLCVTLSNKRKKTREYNERIRKREKE